MAKESIVARQPAKQAHKPQVTRENWFAEVVDTDLPPAGPDGDILMPGQQFEYTFDHIGNRAQTKAGGDSAGQNLRTAAYTRNLLNQYTIRVVPGTVDLMGFAPAVNPVTFATPPGGTPAAADFRWGEFYQKALSWTNTSAARFEGVDISTDGQPGPEETRWVFLPKTPEWFSHDTDGNLLSDGKWLYTWDGENRLIAMETSAPLPAAMPPVRLEFVYDYMSRRCVKRLFDKSGEGAAAVGGSAVVEGSAAAVVQSDEEPVAPESGGVVVIPVGWTLTSTFKFVWDGWNLLAELDGEDGVLRTCAWGLDLSGSEQGAGGVGGLVFQYLSKPDTTYHLFYDGNGNVTSLRDDGGALSCEYSYGPFGETLTARGDDAALAYNAFKFSTKYADAESGLLYYGYRYYNPGTGRWLNRDPIEERDGASLYHFTLNAPTSHLDLLGLRRIWFEFSAFIGGFRVSWLYEPDPIPGPPGVPQISAWQFRTDLRGLGQSNHSVVSPNSRIMSRGWIETTEIGNALIGVAGDGTSATGVSHRRLVSMRRSLIDPNPQRVLDEQEMRAPLHDTSPILRARREKCWTEIRFKASASYPFIGPAPNIDYDVVFRATVVRNGSVTIGVRGEHDGFPDYEAYLDGDLAYTRQSPHSGPSPAPNNLGAPMDVDIPDMFDEWVSVQADTPSWCNCKE